MAFYLPLLILLWPTVGTAAQQPPSAAAQTPPSTDYFNMTAVVIFVVLVFAVFLAAIITIYIRDCSDETRIPRYSSSSSAAAAAARPLRLSSSGLDRAEIDSFPILNYSEIKHLRIGKGALSCAVCVSEFEEDETLRWLPKCDHVFHPECIDPWLASHSTCPLCRANLSRRIEDRRFCMTPPPFPSGTGFLWSARVGVVDNDVTVVESSKAFRKST